MMRVHHVRWSTLCTTDHDCAFSASGTLQVLCPLFVDDALKQRMDSRPQPDKGTTASQANVFTFKFTVSPRRSRSSLRLCPVTERNRDPTDEKKKKYTKQKQQKNSGAVREKQKAPLCQLHSLRSRDAFDSLHKNSAPQNRCDHKNNCTLLPTCLHNASFKMDFASRWARHDNAFLRLRFRPRRQLMSFLTSAAFVNSW